MKSKLIVALDVDNYEQATTLVRDLGDVVGIFKVGSQLFTRVGPTIVEFINDRGKQVFLTFGGFGLFDFRQMRIFVNGELIGTNVMRPVKASRTGMTCVTKN